MTQQIRAEMATRGQLGSGCEVKALAPVWLNSKTRRVRDNYREGMVMEQWNADDKTMARWTLHRVGAQNNTLALINDAGERQALKVGKIDDSWTLYKPETLNVAEGDALRVTAREAKGELRAGDQVRVSSVSEAGITVTAGNKTVVLDAAQALKVSHDYVEAPGRSLSAGTRVLAAVSQSGMTKEGLSQLARSGERVSLYTSMDADRARSRLASSPEWRLASDQVKDTAGEENLDVAIDRQRSGLWSPAELAVRLGAQVAQAEHRSGMVFTVTQLQDAAARSAAGVRLFDIQTEIARQVAGGELMRVDAARGVGVNLLVPRASYEAERSIVRHIAEGKGAVPALMDAVPAQVLDGLTAGQREATQLILGSQDRFLAIQGYAGVGKTTQLKAVMAALETLPAGLRPEITGLAPTHRAVHEMQSVGVKAQTLASFLTEEKMKQHDGEVNRYAGRLFLVDESSMVGNRDMAEACQLIAKGGGRAVMSGDTDQLKSPESGVPFAMQQRRSPVDVAVMKDIVRQTPALKAAVYSMIERNHQEAFDRLEHVPPSVVPRKPSAWSPEQSVLEVMKEKEDQNKKGAPAEPPAGKPLAPQSPVEAVAFDYAGRTPEAQRQTLVMTQTNDDRNAVNALIHDLRFAAGETGQVEHTVRALTTVNTKKAALRSLKGWEAHKGKFAFTDNAFWTIGKTDKDAGVVHLDNEHGQTRMLSVRENSTRDVSIWETKTLTLSEGDRLRFAATDNERGYVANSTWDITSIEKDGRMTLTNGEVTRAINPTKDVHDRRIDLAYAVTAHGSQGASETWSIGLLGAEGKRGQLASHDNAYVQLSRAKQHSQVYTDNRDKLMTRLNEASARLSAHDILEADQDRVRDAGNALYGRAKPAADTGIGRRVLKDAGISGDFKGRYVSSSAKYPTPHMALPLWDINGRDAGVLLTEISSLDGKHAFSAETQRLGSEKGIFAGFQQSKDGSLTVVGSPEEAMKVAQAKPESGVLIRLAGDDLPWNLKALTGAVGDDAKIAVAVRELVDKKEFLAPFISREDRREQEIREYGAIKKVARSVKPDKYTEALLRVVRSLTNLKQTSETAIPVPQREPDKFRQAVNKAASMESAKKQMDQAEREWAKDKTLGE